MLCTKNQPVEGFKALYGMFFKHQFINHLMESYHIMETKYQNIITSAYLRRNIPNSPEYNPIKSSKIFNRFEKLIQKSFSDMENEKPDWRRKQK
jgi:hypothetical protein